MKKLLYLFVVFFLFSACQKQIIPSKSRAFYQVNVGSTANDGTGTTIRQAFQWQNSNWSAQQDTNKIDRDSLAIHRTAIQARTTVARVSSIIHDTNTANLASATDLATYVSGRLDSLTGTGGSVGMYELRGIVGTTSGFPGNGDSLIINSNFDDHPRLALYRNGSMMWFNSGLSNNTGNQDSTFVLSGTTLKARPPFKTNEKVIVQAYDPIIWHTLTPEGGTGGGGGSGASNLLTDLVAFWQLNETGGTSIIDEKGTYTGTATSITLGTAGKFGTSVTSDASTDKISFGNTGFELDSLSVSFWMKTSTTPGDAVVIVSKRITGPNRGFAIGINETDNIVFYLYNSTAGYGLLTSAADVVDGNWHNIVCTHDGANMRLWVDGTEDSYSPQAWAYYPDYSAGATPMYLLNSYFGVDGAQIALDAVGIWHHVLRNSLGVTQITDLQTKTYPFN